MPAQIVLPADVYDALHFSALAFGGIGSSLWYECDGNPTPGERVWYHDPAVAPVCPLGHMAFAGAADAYDGMPISAFGLTYYRNDDAYRRAGKSGQRLQFDEWCALLNVVRGES